MKALVYESNTEDEDEVEEDDDFRGHTMFGFNNAAALIEPMETANSFTKLGVDDEDEDDGPPNLSDSDPDPEADPELNPHPVTLLNDVAYRLYREKAAARKKAAKAPKAPKQKNAVLIKSVADFDRPAAKVLIHALPRDRKSLARLAKLCPEKEEVLGANERWVMADSGSSLHAMDIAKELPGYEHLVCPLPEGKKGRGAETASGDRVEIRGTVSLTGHVDGRLHTVPFNDMKTTMPIASMRQTVKKGNDFHIISEGGIIRNKKTGGTIKLHERGGVYFFKMKFLPPSEQIQPNNGKVDKSRKNRSLGFPRPA